MNTFKTTACVAIGLALAGSIAHAQSSSGNIIGDAKVGEKIIVRGEANGFHRELEIKKDGKFQIRRVPTGDYFVIKVKSDGTEGPEQSIVVKPGGSGRVQ